MFCIKMYPVLTGYNQKQTRELILSDRQKVDAVIKNPPIGFKIIIWVLSITTNWRMKRKRRHWQKFKVIEPKVA